MNGYSWISFCAIGKKSLFYINEYICLLLEWNCLNFCCQTNDFDGFKFIQARNCINVSKHSQFSNA